jgi:type IV pilus assembly protein PilV
MNAMSQRRRQRTPQRQQGAALMEVLMSMVVVALWLLASAGMQVGMLKLQKSAEFRIKAIALATELGERMEANAAGARAGSYSLAAGAATPQPTDCAATPCTPTQLAQYDLAQWAGRVSSSLKGNEISVVKDASSTLASYSISISWQEPRGAQTYSTSGTTETMTYTTVKVL